MTDQPSQAATSTDIVVAGIPLPLSEVARERFTQGIVTMLTVNKANGAPAPIVHAWLEQAAAYDLDPIVNEIWLARMGNAWTVLVGRDGYLKVAKRDANFVTCDGQAVYENDGFEATYVDDTVGWKVSHTITNPARRGKLTGAWAKLVRKGKPTAFFFAPIEQFKQGGGAWKYADTMIVKCAASYLLRTTYNISGPAPSDELEAGFITPDGQVVDQRPEPEQVLPEGLAALVARAAAVDAKAWRPNEVLARLPIAAQDGDGAYEMAVAAVSAEIAKWLETHEPVDAELVDDATAPASVPAEPSKAQDDVSAQMSPEEAQERYDGDEEWRHEVDRALQFEADVEASADDNPDFFADADEARSKRVALGLPPGWTPQMPGQTSLEV